MIVKLGLSHLECKLLVAQHRNTEPVLIYMDIILIEAASLWANQLANIHYDTGPHLVIWGIFHHISLLNSMFNSVDQNISLSGYRLCCDDVCSVGVAVSFAWIFRVVCDLQANKDNKVFLSYWPAKRQSKTHLHLIAWQ